MVDPQQPGVRDDLQVLTPHGFVGCTVACFSVERAKTEPCKSRWCAHAPCCPEEPNNSPQRNKYIEAWHAGANAFVLTGLL